VILIMTTNAGAADLQKSAFGFTKSKREGDDVEAINKLFTPEFRNRLDATIPFGHLSPVIVQQVVDKFVMQLEAQLADRQVTIELTDDARTWLVANGYDELMGARPMARLIQQVIKTPLADEVLFGRLKNGGAVKVVVTTNEAGGNVIGFEYPDGPVAPKPEKAVAEAKKKAAKRKSPSARKAKPKIAALPAPGGSRRGSVPKVPLKTD
jgi:ATP-dependent Clp protease ATP-binding subunit ClpA